jgi:hypothetical protein
MAPLLERIKAADAVIHRAVFFYPPVISVQVAVHQFAVVKHGLFGGSGVLMLFAVQDVRFGDIMIAGDGQRRFHAVLDILHGNDAIHYFGGEIRRGPQGKQRDDVLVCGFVSRDERFLNGPFNLVDVKIHH